MCVKSEMISTQVAVFAEKNSDKIELNNIVFSKDFQIKSFNKIDLQYLDSSKKKNDILVVQNNKNNFLIRGNNFNLSKIIDQILFEH